MTPPPPAQHSRHQQGKPRAGFAHGQFHLSHFSPLSLPLSLRPLHSSSSSSIHLSGWPQPSDSCLVAPWAPGKTPLSFPSLPALSAPVLSSVPLQVIDAFFFFFLFFFSVYWDAARGVCCLPGCLDTDSFPGVSLQRNPHLSRCLVA